MMMYMYVTIQWRIHTLTDRGHHKKNLKNMFKKDAGIAVPKNTETMCRYRDSSVQATQGI